MRLKLTKAVVPWKLSRELRAAGVALLRDVAVMFTKNGLFLPLADETKAEELRPVIEATIEAHDGIDNAAIKRADAERRIENIPGWATWKPAQFEAWFDANIATLNIPADVKTLLRAYGQVILALRDETWPKLGE